MVRSNRLNATLAVLALASLMGGGMAVGAAGADDTSPPAAAPGTETGRHHNPAWAACKKQADDQKLEPGDARRDFMRNCMKSAPKPAPAPATS